MMDIKIEPDDELPPNVLEITYDGGRNQQNAIDSCNTEQLTSNQCSIRVKHEPNDVTDTYDNKEDVLQKIKQETDFEWLNCKQEVAETAAIVKTEEFDIGECSYAEWNPHQYLPTKDEFSSRSVTSSIDSFEISQKTRRGLQIQLEKQEMIRSILNNDLKAVVSLERSIINKENFACGICFTVLPNHELLITHKANCKSDHDRRNPYKCDLCDYKSAFPHHINIHKNKHGGEQQLFKCGKFRYTSTQTDGVSLHDDLNAVKLFKCDLCSYQCKFSAQLKAHKLTHSKEKSFICNVCDYKCATVDSLKVHKTKHNAEKPFHSVDCTFKSAKTKHLKAHKVTHTNVQFYRCDECDFKSNRSNNLKRHKLIHINEKNFKCERCDFRCNRSGNMTIHMMTHTGEKPFKCDICNYTCVASSDFKVHKMRHTGEKPFQCDQCDFKCARATHLKSHKLIHGNEQAFPCDQCELKFNRSGNLKRHKLVHTKEKNFECDQCNYVCNRGSYMKMHQLTHSGKKLYKCDMCAYTCAFYSNLKMHRMTHSGEKPFQCNQCSFKCARVSGLKKHTQRCHVVGNNSEKFNILDTK